MDQLVNQTFRFGTFVLDQARASLRDGDKDIDLRPKTFEVLRCLAGNAQRLLSKEELHRRVWPGAVVGDDSLVQCIRELRLKLGDDKHQLIKTVPRRGYLLNVAVSVAPSDAASDADARSQRHLSLAVLPLENLTHDPACDELAAAVTADLTTELSRYARVVASSTALTYAGRKIDVRQIGRELAVGYVVEGALHLSQDDIRVTVRLVDTRSGTIMWTEAFDVGRRDFGPLRDDVTARLSRNLRRELFHAGGQRSLQDHPDDPDAMDFFIRANAVWVRTPGGRDLTEVRRLFQEALKRDDTFGQAWAGLAMSYLRNVRFSPSRTQDLEAANAAIERAMTLAPHATFSHLALGWAHYECGRMARALVSFEYAAQLNARDPYVQASIGAANIMLGRAEQALAPLCRAIDLSPKDRLLPVWQMFTGVALLHLGRAAEAADWLTRSVALDSGDRFTQLFRASALALAGNLSEAKAAVADLLRLLPGLTLSQFRDAEPSSDPVFLAQRRHIYDGLRRAGLPE